MSVHETATGKDCSGELARLRPADPFPAAAAEQADNAIGAEFQAPALEMRHWLFDSMRESGFPYSPMRASLHSDPGHCQPLKESGSMVTPSVPSRR